MRPGQFAATPLWWEIAYAGGIRRKGKTRLEWIAAPSLGVLVVRQPVDRTYQQNGGVIVHFTLRVAEVDYYWLESDGTINGGNTVPLSIDATTVKQGALVDRTEFMDTYNSMWPDLLATEVTALAPS